MMGQNSVVDEIRASQNRIKREQMTHTPQANYDAWKPFKTAGKAVEKTWDEMPTSAKVEFIASMHPVAGPPIALKDSAKYLKQAGSEIFSGQPIEAAKSTGLSALSALGVLPGVPAVAGMIGGKGIIPPEVLAKANLMKSKGSSVDEIYKATSGMTPNQSGIYLGHPDGKPRIEFPDEGTKYHSGGIRNFKKDHMAALKEHPNEYTNYAMKRKQMLLKVEEAKQTGTYSPELHARMQADVDEMGRKIGLLPDSEYDQLSNFLEHPYLYNNYPQMKKTNFAEVHMPSDSLGAFDTETKQMLINKAAPKLKQHGTSIHESTHAIQQIENMAGGSNPSKHLSEVITENLELTKKINKIQADIKTNPKLTTAQRQDLLSEMMSLMDKRRMQSNAQKEAFMRYFNEPGEVEARIADQRKFFPQKYRDENPFYKMYPWEKK